MRVSALFAVAACAHAAPPIDRRSVVNRHNPVASALPLDTALVSSLGNGAFAFTVDVTGLQSLNASYATPFDLLTAADWGWHSSPIGAEALSSYNYSTYQTVDAATSNASSHACTGRTRPIRYPTGDNSSKASGDWLHNNPHRLPLVQFALAWEDRLLAPSDLVTVAHRLDAWAGVAYSNVSLHRPDKAAATAFVQTTVHPDVDALSVRVALSSPQGVVPLVLRFAFPYTVDGTPDWDPSLDLNHTTALVSSAPGRFTVERTLDGDGYRMDCSFNASWGAPVWGASPHVLLLIPPAGSYYASTDCTCLFAPKNASFPVGAGTPWLQGKRESTVALQSSPQLPDFSAVSTASAAGWSSYWMAGAFLDLAGPSNAAPGTPAFELERRVVRSLYLLRALEAGAEPPPESGLLTPGHWFGKHHGEMRWWHQAWAAFWGRSEVLARSDAYYADMLPNATSVAASQGYPGARWPKMTAANSNRSGTGLDVPWVGLQYAPLPSEVNGGVVDGLAPLLAWESSNGIGPLLLWQQPHSILLAEAQRRAAAAGGGAAAATVVMQRLADVVFATADFLVHVVAPDAGGVYHLCPPLFGGDERGDPLQIYDPSFELVQVNEALDTAIAWRAALGLPPMAAWDAVAGHLAPPPSTLPRLVPHSTPTTRCARACTSRGPPAPTPVLGVPPPVPTTP